MQVVVYEDSALVKAVRHGRVAVVDEVDKAPVEVVCVLKSLLEDGQMRLSDGRRILCPKKFGRNVDGAADREVQDDSIIWIHPDFKLIALANRPGFPFLGNDFFGTISVISVTKCHCVVMNARHASLHVSLNRA